MPSGNSYISASFKSHLEIKPPRFLYHYTNQDGLIGVIKNSTLWATKIHYINNSTEFSLALELARDTLTEGWTIIEVFGDGDSLPPRQRLAKQLLDSLDRIAKINIFVACFCEHPDLLSQWRGYSHGSYGYSIGFSGDALASRTTSGNFPFFLGKCIYDSKMQRAIIRESVERCLSHAAVAADVDQDVIKAFLQAMIQCGALFKDSAFEHEQEWRLVSSPIRSPQISFRPGKSMITPYFPICIGAGQDSSIEHLIVGPCPHMELAKDAVVSLLISADIGKRDGVVAPAAPPQPDVRGSTIPFRDW